MASSIEESRQWQWIFRALWSAAPKLMPDQASGCGAPTVEDLPSRRRRCQLHLLVPDTILFERGVPCKWIGCAAEGIVVRKPFFRAPSTSGCGHGHMPLTTVGGVRAPAAAESRHPALVARVGIGRPQSPPSRAFANFEVIERLDAVIAAFSSFAAALPTPSSADGTNTRENPPVCVARYDDGSKELLSEKSLRSLYVFHNWRASLCALQAYVRPAGQAKSIVGTYACSDERRKVPRRRHRPIGIGDEPRLEVQATTGPTGGGIHDGNYEPVHGISGTLATPVASGAEHKRGREAMDDEACPSHLASQVSAAAVDQATEDVAFVTDMSYAWPREPKPCAASSRDDSDAASKSQGPQDFDDNNSVENKKLASYAGKNQSGARPILVVGGSTCQRSNPRCPWPKSRVRVSKLEAEFVVDQGGRLWFTNVTKVLVQSVRKTPAKVVDEGSHRRKLKRAKEEAILASSIAARELRAVIGLASRRGLNAEDVFQHFSVDDKAKVKAGREKGELRRIGNEEIVQGMAGLGISLSEQAASLLIEAILRSRGGSPAELSMQFPGATSPFSDSVGQPRSAERNGVGSTASACSDKPVTRGERGVSCQPSAKRLENMPLSPLRHFVTAEDLWKFAYRELKHCAKAPGNQVTTTANDHVQHDLAQGKHERLPSSPLEITGALRVPSPNRLSYEGLDRSAKRRRTKSSRCSRGGGGAVQKGGRNRAPSENLLSTEEACRDYPSKAFHKVGGKSGGDRSVRDFFGLKKHASDDHHQQSNSFQTSLPTTPSFCTIDDPGGAPATTAAHLPTGNIGEHRSLHALMTTHIERGVQEAGGTFGSDFKPTLPGHGFSKVGGHRVPAIAALSPRAFGDVDLASFPCDDPVFEAMNCKDRVFHVDRGLVIAYRVLRHQSGTNTVGRPGNRELPPPAVEVGDENSGSFFSGPRFTPTLMVVVPGLFQTLDTLEKALLPLLAPHPRLTILVVAPPGMPNTHWPAAASLNGELTAICVSTLLEHLLEGGELLSNHHDNRNPPTAKPDEFHGDQPPHTDPETSGADLDPPTQSGTAGEQAATPSTRVDDEENAASSSGLSASARPNTHRFQTYSSEASPAIFVGFGTGANSILHLAAAPRRTSSQPLQHEYKDDGVGGLNSTLHDTVGGVVGDDGASKVGCGRNPRGTHPNGVGIHEQERDPLIHGGGGKASDGLLVSMLRRQGLRISGLILVNGFMSVDEPATQVLHTLRKAFCDQSDGRARTDAVASLLLSEKHLATETAAAAATPPTAAMKMFLETREAFRLDADVSALARPQACGALFKGKPISVTGSAKMSALRRVDSLPFPGKRDRGEGGASVESVLREMGVSSQKRKRRLIRRQRRRGMAPTSSSQRRQRDIELTEACSGGDDSEEEHPNGDFLGSEEDQEQGETSDYDRDGGRCSSSQQRSSHDPGSRLALAASVSTLTGLIESRGEDRGESGGGGSGVVSCGEVNGGSVRGASNRILGALKSSKLPLVLVQSTEDALVASPLALVLKKEFLLDDTVLAEAGSVLACLKPMPLYAASGNVAREDQDARRPSGGGEVHGEEKDEGQRDLIGGGGNRRDSKIGGEEQAQREERKEGLLSMHTCWVKAGHDVLYERGPFMRALLHKAIYGCYGQEAPPQRFPGGNQECPKEATNAAAGAHTNGHGLHAENPFSGGDEGQPGVLLPPRPIDYTVDEDEDKGRREQLQGVDTEDLTCSNSQEARDTVFPRRTEERGSVGGLPPTDDDLGGEGGDVTVERLLDTPPGDLEVDNSEGANRPSSPFIATGAGEGNGGAAAGRALLVSSTATTVSGTAEPSSLSSAATSVLMGRAPKLLDFFDTDDEGSSCDFRGATEYIEKFREFDLDRAILEKGLGATGERLAALDLPLVARYTFQTMKDCWRCKMLVVEAARLDLGMRKRQANTREQLALSIRAVNNMTRILRKSNNHVSDPGDNNNKGEDDHSNVEHNILHLEPLDQQALKVEITAAEITRATHYNTCRRLRRSAALFRARRERLESTLVHLTEGVRGTLVALERMMGQLRKNITLARIQERVFHEEVVKADARGLKARRRLTVVKGKLTTLALHRQKWTDSDAWQPGYVQRLETAELVKILAAEGRKLQLTADAAEVQSERARELHKNVSQQEAGLASTMEGVGALFSLLNSALEDENFVQDSEAAVEAQMAIEHENLGSGDDLRENKRKWRRTGGGGRRGLQDAAGRVRATPHLSRTHDEKSWVALDAVVNPQLYHHVTLAEAEEMRWDALYYTRLDREDVLRIMSLPPQVQLALPFLHTPSEVAAHELLMRYSLGINAEHFAQLDKNSQDISRTSNTGSTSSCSDQSAALAKAAIVGVERNNTAGSVPRGGGEPASVGADGDTAGATHRVLQCMQRAAGANLKIIGERNEEEAVWCVLDRKLRPDLYRESDDAAADRNEVLHQEADAREDARHAWLAPPEERKMARNTGTTHDPSAGGGGTAFSSVVEQTRGVNDASTTQKAAQDHEATAVEVDRSCSANCVKNLAAAAAGGSLAGVEEQADPHQENDQELVTSIVEAAMDGKGIADADGVSGRENGQSEESGDYSDETARANKRSEQPEQRRRLEEIVRRVLSRFLVAEEETPLGRDMTRSLAMLQEVVLRLIEGKGNIFSGLNPHTALAATRSRTLMAGHTLMPASPTDVGGGDSRIASCASSVAATSMAGVEPAAPRGNDEAAATATRGNDEEEGAMLIQGVTIGSVLTTSPIRTASKDITTKPSLPNESMLGNRVGIGSEQQLQEKTNPLSEVVTWPDSGIPCGSGSVVSCGGTNAISYTPRGLQKVFGSWEEVHPAALGIGSQEKEFSAQESEGAEGEHPASFGRNAANQGGSTGSSTLSSPLTASGFHAHDTNRKTSYHDIICSPPLDPLDILTGDGRSGAAPGWLYCQANVESNLIASGMDKVGEFDPGEVQRRGLLVASRQRTCLLDVKTSELQAGQSKAYAFQVGPYAVSSGSSTPGSSVNSSKETSGPEIGTVSADSTADVAKVVVGIALTVVYQGNFEPEGYRLGRLAAGLYRVASKHENDITPGRRKELPQPVGFAPYSLQSLNTPESIGRIMIFHQPRVQPVRAGRFQLVLGAASRVRYSVSIVAVTAADAMAAFNESVKDAQRLQKRVPSLLEEMEGLKAISKLSRWKQRVVGELLEEAREEAVRCDGEINEVKREIQEEENDQKLDDEGRRAMLAEARDLNAEISRWKNIFASRVQEGKDLRTGLGTIQSKLKVLQDEEDDLRKKLAQARRNLPAAAFVLKDQREATDVALALNATVDKYSGSAAKWAAADLLKERGEVILSPADRVSRALKDEGWDALTMDEKRFTMLDRILRPDLYQWMKESRLNEEGDAVLAPELPIAPKRRKDSLATLIGAGPIGTKSLESAENIEDAMQARNKQGWSKKATEFATPSAWSGKSKAMLDNAGDAGIASGSTVRALTARSDTTSAGALTARSGATGIKSLTLADEWRLRDFSFTAMELERVRGTPFHRLQRKELKARKLLGRFHDDNHNDRSIKASAEKIAREAERRCASVRAKDKALRTEEESEWVEIDKKLFPEVWVQKNRQEDRLQRFNMTLSSIPKLSTRSEDNGDSEESENDRDDLSSIGGRSGCREWRARPDRNGKNRKSRWMSTECPFDREEIIQIWASDRRGGGEKHRKGQRHHQRKRGEDRMADREDDIRRVRELLLTFNGPYATFAREAARRDSQETMDGCPLTLSTSKRIAYYAMQQSRVAAAYARDHADLGRPPGSARGPGPDEVMSSLLRELMTAKAIHSKYMDTNVAHGTAQRFSTEHYAKELEREIAAQLREQILERERAMTRDASDLKYDEASVSESSDDEAENWEAGLQEETTLADKNKNPADNYRGGEAIVAGAHLSGADTSWTRASTGNHARGSHDNGDLGLDMKPVRQAGGGRGDFSHTSTDASDGPSAPKHGGGGSRGGGSSRIGTIAGNAGAEKASWHDLPVVEEFTQDEVNELVHEDPMWEGCRACRTLPCRWCSCVDYRSIGARKTQVRDELFRLMGFWDQDEVVTVVPLSCVRGGPTTLLRTEAISELRWEAKELDRQLHLAAVDKELHDAYACAHEAIEVQSLHEYSTLMWTKDAQAALSKERELTLARTTSQEAVDDLLESMLDGWVFGERQGEHAAGGIIPAVKLSGPLRPGDQRRAVAYLEHRHRLRRIAHAKGERLPEEVKGTQHTKALPIDDIAQRRIADGRATKRKEDQGHLLRETETTMKFGLFSMVQSYLHAMTLVQREKEAWSGKGDVMTREGRNSVPRPRLTSERKKMIEEAVKARERAATRKKFLDRARKAEDRNELREAKNKRRVSQRKAMRILEIRERGKAARNIQRVFRGFRGKVFAQRWALKRAEVEALKSVLHEAAVNVQRAFRGHLGRVEASEVRMELAEYIADIRVKEAESDIADFWETHRLKATKDELKKKLLNTIGKPLVAMRRKKLE